MAQYKMVRGVTHDKAENPALIEVCSLTNGGSSLNVWGDTEGRFYGWWYSVDRNPVLGVIPWELSKPEYEEFLSQSMDEYESNLLLKVD